MKYTVAILFTLLSCNGCGGGQLPSTNSVPEKAAPAATSESYPKLEWACLGGGRMSSGPASVPGLRMWFEDSRWTEASDPEFSIWLTENDFFQITIAPDSKKIVGTVKETTMIGSGPMRGGALFEIRTTQPIANESEALLLLEAYLKQDGTFDTLVRWSDAVTSDSDAEGSERSP